MEIDLKDFLEKIDLQIESLNNKTPPNFAYPDKTTFEDETIQEKNFDEDLNEDNSIIKTILDDLNKNIFIDIKEEEEDKNQKACKEILGILRYSKSNENIRGVISPFKPLAQPRKISMIGKVFYNYDNDNSNKTRENTFFNVHINDVKKENKL